MRIDVKTTLIFTITSENPPHTLAVDFIKQVGKHYECEVEAKSVPMEHGALDQRTTEFHITDGESQSLGRLADNIRDAMNMIGVAMSGEYSDEYFKGK